MATANITYTDGGVQYNLTITFAGAATSGQAIGISGTAGGANVIALDTFFGGDNIVNATAPYFTDWGLSFRTDGPENNNQYNIYDNGNGYDFYRETPGGTATSQVSTISYTASTNTDPTVNFNTGSTVAEGGTDTIAATELDFNDAQQNDPAITYTVTSAATNGTLFRNGVALGVNGTFTQEDINDDLISYTHNGSETTTASFGFSVSDGQGSTVPGQTFTFAVTPGNDAPLVATNNGRTLNEGVTAGITGAQLTVNDPEQGHASLVFTVTTAAANGTLLLNGDAVSSGGTFTQADVDNGDLSYQHNGGETTADSFIFSVTDGVGGTVSNQTFNLTINPVNDPTTAADDAFTIGETSNLGASQNVFNNNFFGVDSDPDSVLVVTAVNGSGANVNNQITLASGATLTLNADGTFFYSPNGAFNDLAAAGSGSTNLSRNDSFTYAVNGVTATVTVTVNGRDSDGDLLVGTSGIDDSFTGGIGSDRYNIEDTGDTIVEVAGQGSGDRAFASVSFTLSADDDIEILSTNSSTGNIAINLRGNTLAQAIYGNNGANILHDGGTDVVLGTSGVDRMVGLGGNDTYIVYNAGALIVEAAGQGNDRVAAGVDYKLATGVSVEFLNTTSLSATYAINLTGNNLAQTIRGNNGVNILNDGGAGAADTLIGGDGNDNYIVQNSGDMIVELGGQGTDRVSTSVDFALTAGASIELFTTTKAAGSAAIDLTGNELAQSIVGNAGDNRLDGRGGTDILAGSFGADTFVFSTALGAGNVDTITGYSVADDSIELDDAIFTALAPGALAAGAFSASAGAAASDPGHRILYDTQGGGLFYDADGDGNGAAIRFATLSAGLSLTSAEFLVV